MAEEAIKPAQATEDTVTSADGQSEQNNTSNGSEADQTQKTGNGRSAQDRIRELVEENKKLKQTPAEKKASSSDSSEDRVLELVGKIPEHLKAEMKNIAQYVKAHDLDVDDAIALWNTKLGHTVPKSEVDKYQAANAEANDSRTGGTANPAVRENNLSQMSDKDLEAQVKDLASKGMV